MFKCDVIVHPKYKPRFDSQDRQEEPLPSTKEKVRSCYVTAADYLLIFLDEATKKPFYELKTGGLDHHLDETANTLTLTRRKKSDPLVTIHSSDNSALKELDDFCEEFSDETIQWSPLVYTASTKEEDLVDANKKKKLNIRGVILLTFIILFYAKLENIVANLRTYGLFPKTSSTPFDISILIYALVGIVVRTAFMMGVEKLAFKNIISNKVATFLGAINMAIGYILPVYYCRTYHPDTSLAFIYVFWSAIMIMKMISYMHFMHNLREILPKIQAYEQSQNGAPQESIRRFISRENLEVAKKHLTNPSSLVDLKHLMYFYWTPTLVFQLWFPRTERINWSNMAKLTVQLVIASSVSFFWTVQLVLPVLRDAAQVFMHGGDFWEKFEHLLKLTNGFAVLFAVNTYLILHLFPHFLAEITRFKERDFYQDWWNSPRIRVFWSRWNRPVHFWCQRHLFYPLARKGCSRVIAGSIVFLFSSVMHEYLVSVPCGVFAFYAMGLMLQIPLIWAEIKFDSFFERISKYSFGVFGGVGVLGTCYAMILYHIKQLEAEGAGNV